MINILRTFIKLRYCALFKRYSCAAIETPGLLAFRYKLVITILPQTKLNGMNCHNKTDGQCLKTYSGAELNSIVTIFHHLL